MKIILGVVTGGIIGYFTNWLAIKMLFRPLEEKYFLGRRLAFTPGLIPKEKDRIARTIGMTVEEYLLSPEAIMKSLEENNFKLKFKHFIGLTLDDFKNKDYRLGDLIEEYMGDRLETIHFQIRENLREAMVRTLVDMDLKTFIEDMVNKELTNEENIKFLQDWTKESYKNFINRQESKERIIAKLSREFDIRKEKKLGEVLPKGLEEDINRYIDENYKLLAFKLREILGKDNIKGKLKLAIRQLVEENVGGLLASFIPMEMVGEKGYLVVATYLESEAFKKDLKDLLGLLVNNLYESKLEDISKNLGETIDLNKLASYILSILDSKLIEEELGKLIEKLVSNLNKEKIYLGLEGKIRSIIRTDEFKLILNGAIDKILGQVLSLKLSTIIKGLYIDEEHIYNLGEKLFNAYLKKDINKLIKDLNISGIVEKTILEFDNEFTEKLILDIASKELKLITILGGILGMIIGGINPIIQSIL